MNIRHENEVLSTHGWGDSVDRVENFNDSNLARKLYELWKVIIHVELTVR